MGIFSKDAEQLNNDLMMDQGALKAYHSIVELFKGDNVKNFQGTIRKHCLNSYEATQVIQSTYLAIRNTIQSELNSLLFDEWLPELSNISTEIFHYGNACGVADNIDKEIIKRLTKNDKKLREALAQLPPDCKYIKVPGLNITHLYKVIVRIFPYYKNTDPLNL